MSTYDETTSRDTLLMVALILAVAALIAVLVLFSPWVVRRHPMASGSACVNHLRQIDGAKEQWALENKQTNGTPAMASDVTPYLKGAFLPACPNGGTYIIGKVGEKPRCSMAAAGHTL